MMVDGMPALTNQCRNMCMWAGQISFTNDGQIPIPPPITTPPPGDPAKIPSGDEAPLTEQEEAQLPPSDQQQYHSDLATADQAGGNEQKMGEAFKKTADDYKRKGEPEKAALAEKKSEAAFSAAEDKRNVERGKVNGAYRKKLDVNQKQS